MRLNRLHTVIQVAMGWTNSHLHQFIVGRTFYGQADPEFQDLHRRQEEFLRAYRAQDWDAADAALAAILPLAGRYDLQKLVQTYTNRVKAYRAAAPPADWDGVFEALSK